MTSQYIIYCLDMKTHFLDIVDICNEEKNAKMIQNNHAFNLLCELNKENCRLYVKNNIIYIFEVNVKIQKGWMTNVVEEQKKILFQVGLSVFGKKESVNISKEKIDEQFYSAKKIEIPKAPPPPPASKVSKENKNISWDDIMGELKTRRKTIH